MPKTILLADDSITIQKVVELTFSDGDYTVVAVNNGTRAIERLAEVQPDIILSDIIMPEKNGYEVCEYVKSHPEYRHIPVVLLTGTFEPFDPDRAEKAGCDAVVTKPFESQSLIHKVEELIEQAPARSASPEQPHPDAATAESSEIETETPGWGVPPQPGESESAPFGGDAPFAGAGGFDPAPGTVDSMPAWETMDAPAGGADSFASDAQPRSYEPQQPDTFESRQDASATSDAGGDRAGTSSFSDFSEHDDSVFGSPADTAPPSFSTEDPFDSGSTQAFPKMSYEELAGMQQGSPDSSSEESSGAAPWEQPPAADDRETASTSPWQAAEERDSDSAWATSPEGSSQDEEPSPWGAPADTAKGDEEPSPWAATDVSGRDEAASPWETAAGGAQQDEAPSPWEAPAGDAGQQNQFGSPAADDSPAWDTSDDDDASTRMIPRMSLEEMREIGEQETGTSAHSSPWLTDEPSSGAFGAADEPLSGAAAHAEGYAHADSPFGASDDSPVSTGFASDQNAAASQGQPADEGTDHFGSDDRAAELGGDLPSSDPGQDPYAVAETPEYQQETGSFEGVASDADDRGGEESAVFGATGSESSDVSRSDEPWSTAASPFEDTGDESATPWSESAQGADTDRAWEPASAESMPDETPQIAATPAVGSEPGSQTGAVTDEQIEKIARRVVELMSEDLVRRIAWEVIPDMAEMVVKERLRQLESEDA